MAKVYWLVSYPKCGNTWVRALLSNYASGSEHPVDINHLDGNPWTNRQAFDAWLGLASGDLTKQEIQRYRPAYHRFLAERMPEGSFVKVHDAFTYTDEGEALFPDDITAGVIYLTRDPLDICVSYAHHENLPFDRIIEMMNDYAHWLLPSDDGLRLNLPQYLGAWRLHLAGWQKQFHSIIKIISYEQLQQKPSQTLAQIVRYLNWTYDTNKIDHALLCSGFDQLASQERTQPFFQKPATAQRFFREGKSGSGAKRLNSDQQLQLLGSNGRITCASRHF